MAEKEVNDLIVRGSNGDERAQREIYDRFYRYAFFTCLKYVSDNDEVQLIVNDSFVKVFRNLSKFDLKYPFQSWLKRIVINTAIDFLRKGKKITYSLDEAKSSGNEAFHDSVIDTIAADDIMKVLERLPNSYRMVFTLFVIENYKHEEIAQQLGITVGASKSNLFKARNKLKIILKEELGYEEQDV